MSTLQEATGAQAGYSGDAQIKIALQRIANQGGVAQMADLYQAMEDALNSKGKTLSRQGKDSLRFFINKVAVKAGYVYPHDRKSPGWRITPEGHEFIKAEVPAHEVTVNVDSGLVEEVPSNVAKGAAFELYVLKLLRAAYPHHAWYHQGAQKRDERGLDFIGERFGNAGDEPKRIGVQVKLRGAKSAPTDTEWLKFLSGCFARRVDAAFFVTTGKLTGEQRREAQEAGVLIIEGREEVIRLAQLHTIGPFEFFDEQD